MEEKQIKPMEIYDFANLLLATLAKNSDYAVVPRSDIKVASLPANYKSIIQCILTAKNGWREEFSSLIDVKEYFDDHFAWEALLGENIKKVLKDLGKAFEYSFGQDSLLIFYSMDEIATIMDDIYTDKGIKNKMDHFANLLSSYIYTRQYQENFHDPFAESVRVMAKINSRDEETSIDDILKADDLDSQPKKVL